MRFQLRHGTHGRFGDQNLELIEQAEHTAHAQKTREVRGRRSGFEALYRSESKPRALGQLILGEILREAERGETFANVPQYRRIRRFMYYYHIRQNWRIKA
jgi:hypothetical protein